MGHRKRRLIKVFVSYTKYLGKSWCDKTMILLKDLPNSLIINVVIRQRERPIPDRWMRLETLCTTNWKPHALGNDFEPLCKMIPNLHIHKPTPIKWQHFQFTFLKLLSWGKRSGTEKRYCHNLPSDPLVGFLERLGKFSAVISPARAERVQCSTIGSNYKDDDLDVCFTCWYLCETTTVW